MNMSPSKKPASEQMPSMPLFLVFVVTLLALYKFTIWDPYFNPAPTAPTAAQQPVVPGDGTIVPNPSAPQGAPVAPITGQQPIATTPAVPTSGLFPSDQEVAGAGLINVTTETLDLNISLLGGRITRWNLRSFAETLAHESPRLNLIEHHEGAPYPFGVYLANQDDARVVYSLVVPEPSSVNGKIALSGTEQRTVQLVGRFPDGAEITKIFSFTGEGFLIGTEVQVKSNTNAALEAPIEVEWVKLVTADSPSLIDSYGNSGYVWYDGARATRQAFKSVPAGEEILGKNLWVSLSDKYFSISLVSPGGPIPTRALHEEDHFRARFLGDPSGFRQQIYGGPNSYSLLEKSGSNLELVVNFGKLKFLSAPLLTLLNTFSKVLGNYGLAIVLLTILVKMCVLPLTAASFKSMKAMQDIQPEVQRLRETTKDKAQQQQQLMELYKKKGVNPLGGCLPIFIQLPIFLGLYSALNLAVELRHAPFALWIHDLSAPEKLMVGGIGIPIMVLLLTLSMLIQQWTTPSTMDETQKKVMLAMPLVFGYMFMNFPAGLTLYWLVSNIISIGQTHSLRKGHRSPFLVTSGVCLMTFGFAFLLSKL